uniref:Uncharacterized protein n=1 Tax=Petromyzon marinus TaxID=7757 RepID=S4RK96_PETMA
MPEQFDQASVLGQLRFSGVLGMVHLRQAGFPARRDVHEFHNRYRVLMRKLALPEDTRSRCVSFLRVYDSSETQWQLGKSRVFMHEGLERDLERQRNEERHRAATVIRAHALGYATRKWYRTVLQSVLTIQRSYRTHRWRRRYLLLTATSEVLTTDHESVYLRSHKNHLVLPAREMATDTFQTDIGGSGQSDELAEFGIFIGSANDLNLNVVQKDDTVITRVSDSCHEDGTLAFPDMLHMKQAEEFHLLELPLDKEPMAQPLTGTISEVQCNQTEEAMWLDAEATRAGHEFLESLRFDDILHSIEESLEGNVAQAVCPPLPVRQGSKSIFATEVTGNDQGLHQENEGPLENELDVVEQLSDQRTSGAHTCSEVDFSSEEQLYANETMDVGIAKAAASPASSPRACDAAVVPSAPYCNRPADPADKSSEASTEPGSPHTNPDEENVYSTVENHDTVFTCSTTFQVPQSSRPVTLDCTYRFSFGSGTKSARARGSSEGTAKFESEGECVARGSGVSDEESTLQDESVYSSIGAPFHQGFLSLQESLAAAWKRRWCVLSEGTFTWFRTRQEATLSGWLDKQGQGRPPLRLARRSWKRRWFVLRPSGLAYYDSDREERQRGTIDLASVREVSGDEHRENCFDVITEDRTYRLRAPSQEDARRSRWLGLLERVRGATEDQLQKMFQESSDPNSALGSLEAGILDEAYADADHPDRPHTFALVSGSRTLFCNADTADDVQRWLMLLQRSKRDVPGDGGNIILRGWLYKASASDGPLWASCPRLRRRWFVLTAGALEYYRGSEANAPRAGCLVLTPMCSVSPLDGTHQGRTGNWSFTVYGRRDSYTLYSRQQGEATRWAHAIQRAIDSKGCADTPTSLLIQDIAESGDDPDLVDRTCTRNPILRYSPRALLSPLLPLPYGDNHSNPYGYSSLPEEAVRLSLCLLELEGVRDPTPMVQGILQTCWDLLPLRDELYCQLVKQTMTWEGVDGPTMVWHLLACTSCTFAPSHAVLRYLHLHLRRMTIRALERSRDQELCRYVAFTWTALQCKLCRQSVPSRDEIRALAEGQEISTTIFCHGGGSCPISITSHVTAGEVVARLLRGLRMEGSCSKFALFECGPDGERAIEENALLVDSLARFERLAATREGVDKNQWKIFFKLYLVLDTAVAPEDSIEMAFMFEQAHDSMARGRFPVSGETLQWMAALRLQFVHGNSPLAPSLPPPARPLPQHHQSHLAVGAGRSHSPRTWVVERSTRGEGLLRRSLREAAGSFLRLRRSRRDRQERAEDDARGQLLTLRAEILAKWRLLHDTDPEQAVAKYMQLVQQWSGYGATLFDVQCTDGQFPRELWLAVSLKSLSVYVRGQAEPIVSFPYERILSFGAAPPADDAHQSLISTPLLPTFQLIIDGREIIFQTTEVAEISKLMEAYINVIMRKREIHTSTQSAGKENSTQ